MMNGLFQLIRIEEFTQHKWVEQIGFQDAGTLADCIRFSHMHKKTREKKWA